MIKIKMLTGLVFADNKVYHPRQIVEVDEKTAKSYVDKRLAVFIEEMPKPTKETVKNVEEKPKRQRKPKKEVK